MKVGGLPSDNIVMFLSSRNKKNRKHSNYHWAIFHYDYSGFIIFCLY